MVFFTPISSPATPASETLLTPGLPSSRIPSVKILEPDLTPWSTSSFETPRASYDLKRLSIDSDSADFLDESSTSPKVLPRSRLLSDNELSYFLPGRADGVNDMYLHHRFSSPQHLVDPIRIIHIWAYQLLKHPLLASTVVPESYENVHFVYTPPKSVREALDQGFQRFRIDNSGDLINTYLNGPRTLGNDKLACLVFGSGSDSTSTADQFEFMLCATHFLGDGMALHTFMNEFYTLLGSDSTIEDFERKIEDLLEVPGDIPSSLEDRLPPAVGRLAELVGKAEYQSHESRMIGGQSFPSNPKKLPRKTAVPTFAYSEAETKAILGKCKANGVTIAHAVFALCNLAWSRHSKDNSLPSMIYSALNLRPQLLPPPNETSSFFHLAVGYFMIILPSLSVPTLSTSELFWHRAKITKSQTIKAVKSPFLISRSRETNKIRKARAVKWARIDDMEAQSKTQPGGLGFTFTDSKVQASITGLAPAGNISVAARPTLMGTVTAHTTPETKSQSDGKLPTQATFARVPEVPSVEKAPILPAAPQKALMGVSMLGNLDGMYAHKAFPAIQLQSLTTGSRQRQGGLLLFAYTFAGKLWFSLGYDANGFKPGVIETFWEEIQGLVKEVLL